MEDVLKMPPNRSCIDLKVLSSSEIRNDVCVHPISKRLPMKMPLTKTGKMCSCCRLRVNYSSCMVLVQHLLENGGERFILNVIPPSSDDSTC